MESQNSMESQHLKKAKPPSLTEPKKRVETLWQVVFIFITSMSAVLLQKVYLFQTLDYFAPIRKGHIYDLIWGVLAGVIIHAYEYYLHRILDPWVFNHWIRFDKWTEPESRLKRCHTMAKWIYSLAYYSVSSAVSYYLILNTSILPVWLGGHGQCVNAYINSPFLTEETWGMKVFYLITFGKHLNRFITHGFIRPEGNYYEYLLHHGLSTFLIFFSYLMNYWLIGILIIFIHDLSDLALGAGRLYTDYRYKNKLFLKIQYVFEFGIWAGCRIIIHVCCCCYPVIEAYGVLLARFNETEIEVMELPSLFMAGMVWALEILHVFWTYYILKAFIIVNISDKITRQTYDA